jgi:hypothetical protein
VPDPSGFGFPASGADRTAALGIIQASPEPQDPISEASARLYAFGVDRIERLRVLRFLGALLSEADATGTVVASRADLDQLAVGAGLLAEEGDRSAQWLELAGVVQRDGDCWSINGFRPVADKADRVSPAEAIQAIAEVLSHPYEPVRRSPRERVAATITELRPSRRTWHVAAVGAAAAVVLAVSLISGAVDINGGSRVSSVASPTVAALHTTAHGVGPIRGSNSTGAPAATAPSASVMTGTGVVGIGGTVPAIVPAIVTCPTDTPVAAIASVAPSFQRDGLDTGGWIVDATVSGTLHNPAATSMLAGPLPVTIEMGAPATSVPTTMTGYALSEPVVLAPGATVPWSVTLQTWAVQPGPMSAVLDVTNWHWADPLLSACKR